MHIRQTTIVAKTATTTIPSHTLLAGMMEILPSLLAGPIPHSAPTIVGQALHAGALR